MLGIPIRYLLSHPVSAVADLAADPKEIWATMLDSYAAGRDRHHKSQCSYDTNSDWERQLHAAIGVGLPCGETSVYSNLWSDVIDELESKNIRPGPESFQWWNDGDVGLVRAIWCLTRHLKPINVVETGVAHGVTSRFVLEALRKNGEGHLWSIDRPPLDRRWRKEIGAAVGDRHSDLWTYIRGSSRRRLPELLSRLGRVDLFIHDSLHSERNVLFELNCAWAALAPNGAIVVDDVDANWGFRSFTESVPGHLSMVCEAEPLRSDLRRFNKKGLFGIILKKAPDQIS